MTAVRIAAEVVKTADATARINLGVVIADDVERREALQRDRLLRQDLLSPTPNHGQDVHFEGSRRGHGLSRPPTSRREARPSSIRAASRAYRRSVSTWAASDDSSWAIAELSCSSRKRPSLSWSEDALKARLGVAETFEIAVQLADLVVGRTLPAELEAARVDLRRHLAQIGQLTRHPVRVSRAMPRSSPEAPVQEAAAHRRRSEELAIAEALQRQDDPGQVRTPRLRVEDVIDESQGQAVDCLIRIAVRPGR